MTFNTCVDPSLNFACAVGVANGNGSKRKGEQSTCDVFKRKNGILEEGGTSISGTHYAEWFPITMTKNNNQEPQQATTENRKEVKNGNDMTQVDGKEREEQKEVQTQGWSESTYGDIYNEPKTLGNNVIIAEQAMKTNNSLEKRANLDKAKAKYVLYLKVPEDILTDLPTENKIKSNLMTMDPHSDPGTDEFTTKFYQACKYSIHDD
ncbi:hypothetical protein MTR67_016195 [Solanum verrucosum]|uniref:Uncharacterized protein n=1 Tax=Solanum verrucosum TaxID=315347 RepID=A0AAF0TR48_SOLVR|nr:hypothetical protein MTR67_016195 [Solanum verrucosum]